MTRVPVPVVAGRPPIAEAELDGTKDVVVGRGAFEADEVVWGDGGHLGGLVNGLANCRSPDAAVPVGDK